MGFGFSSDIRLKNGWQFDLIFRTGRRETGDLVRILFIDSPGSRLLVGVAVGRKIAGAAGRARGRRLLRESFRRLVPWIRDEVWIIGSLREKALDRPAHEVYFDLACSLKRRGLLTPEFPGANWNVDKAGSE